MTGEYWVGPLEGVRLADFCWWGVGALCTRWLADFGAEVIKIEDRERLDLTRTTPPFPGQAPRGLGEVGRFPDPDLSGIFNNHNRNKLSLVLNMRDPRGLDIARRLFATSDAVTENFRPGVMERWGFDYASLKQIRRDIVFVRLSGLGHTGPESGYGTAGPVVQALSGLTATAGLPGREPSGWGFSYMDNTAAYYGATCVMMALYDRARVGEGQEVSISAVEAGVNLIGPDLLDWTANHRLYRSPDMPAGNRLPHSSAAPHGVYPTNEPDRWIAIAVFNDDEWQALRRAIGDPTWARDPRFAEATGRVALQDELDEHLGAWTRARDRYGTMELLQAVGVAAGVVQTAEDIQERDPQVRERELFPEVDHPTLGRLKVEGAPFTLSESPARQPWRGAPLLGEHSAYVLTEILGMGSAEIDLLAKDGVI